MASEAPIQDENPAKLDPESLQKLQSLLSGDEHGLWVISKQYEGQDDTLFLVKPNLPITSRNEKRLFGLSAHQIPYGAIIHIAWDPTTGELDEEDLTELECTKFFIESLRAPKSREELGTLAHPA